MAPFTVEEAVSLERSSVDLRRFRVKNGQIAYQLGGLFPSPPSAGEGDWFGCSFCNRYFQHLGKLEEHYGREHEGEESYKFELLELRNSVVPLPYISKVKIPEMLDRKVAVEIKREELPPPMQLLSVRRAIREAIKATEPQRGSGSSFKRILVFIQRSYEYKGADELRKKVRRTLERFVDLKKLHRRYNNDGKSVYILQKGRKAKGNGPTHQNAAKDTAASRHYMDQQLRRLVKKLRPHGYISPKKKLLAQVPIDNDDKIKM